MADQEQEEITPEVKSFMEKKLVALLTQRGQLDQQINLLQTMLGNQIQINESSPLLPQAPVTSLTRTGKIEADSFFGMKVPQAILKYFSLVGKPPRPAIDIQKGLEDGGILTEASNAYSLVYNSLLRLEKSKKVVRVNNAWGLKEWYPHIDGTVSPRKEKEEKTSKPAKPKKQPKPTETSDQE